MPLVDKFKPELTISFCSSEATRISLGLRIRHIAFCNSPHTDVIIRLTLSLIQKLLIPVMITKKEFSKYGIEQKNISYKAIVVSFTIKRKIVEKKKPI